MLNRDLDFFRQMVELGIEQKLDGIKVTFTDEFYPYIKKFLDKQ